MLEYIRENDIDTVLVQYLGRFGRNPKEILSRIWQLGEQGVSVEATDQDIKDEMMLIVNAGMAGHESKRTSERVQANMNRAWSVPFLMRSTSIYGEVCDLVDQAKATIRRIGRNNQPGGRIESN